MMKEWNIDSIQEMTEEEAKGMALETMKIKEHDIYFVDFGGYFGYSVLVFKDGHHIHYVNDYELHHRATSWSKGKTREELREWYIRGANNKLFTEEEISEPLTDYEEYNRKSYFLHNYYGMRTDYISIFGKVTDETQAEFDRKTKTMTYNPIAFAYMPDADFVKHHIELFNTLEKAKENISNNYEYLKSAYLYEMHNHEYGINWQADWDTLSAIYGDIEYHDCDLEAYFKELNFTDLQRRAYLDARKQYFKETENY